MDNTSRIVCLAIANGAELWTDMLPPGAAPGLDCSGLAYGPFFNLIRHIFPSRNQRFFGRTDKQCGRPAKFC